MNPLLTRMDTDRRQSVMLSGLLMIAVCAMPQVTVAQNPDETATSFHDRVVDPVTLKDGTKLWGSATSDKPATLLVRSEWLKSRCAEFYASEIQPHLQKERQQSADGLIRLLRKDIERLEGLIERDPQRIGLLEEIIMRLEPGEDDSPGFVLIEIPKARLRRMDVQPPARKELCRLAILNDVADFEDLSSKAVTARLQAIPQHLRRTVPPAPSDDGMTRDCILAAVDVQLGTATRLVLSGDTVIDESAQSDPAALLSSMLGQNLQSTLSRLFDEGTPQPAPGRSADKLPASASRMADAQKRSTIVLSEFDFDLTGGTATVHRRLFHKNQEGQWKLVLAASEDSSTAALKPGQADALANNPQVQEIAAAVDALGISKEQLSTAVQLGAVVQDALGQAEQSFQNSILDIIGARTAVRSQPIPTIRLAENPPAEKDP